MTLLVLARAVADAAAYLAGMPATAVPLERTDRAPWVWASAQALRSGVDPHELAAALRPRAPLVTAQARADGWLELTLTPEWVAAALADLAAADDNNRAGMPPAPVPAPVPAPIPAPIPAPVVAAHSVQELIARFETARVAGGASALPDPVTSRLTLDNPAVTVLLAHARACRVARQTPLPPTHPGHADPGAVRRLADPLDLGLLTEILDAPRRLARHDVAPHETAAALLAVAAAYLVWEQRCPAVPTRPGEQATPRHIARQAISMAGRNVLERGMALLGMSAPERM